MYDSSFAPVLIRTLILYIRLRHVRLELEDITTRSYNIVVEWELLNDRHKKEIYTSGFMAWSPLGFNSFQVVV